MFGRLVIVTRSSEIQQPRTANVTIQKQNYEVVCRQSVWHLLDLHACTCSHITHSDCSWIYRSCYQKRACSILPPSVAMNYSFAFCEVGTGKMGLLSGTQCLFWRNRRLVFFPSKSARSLSRGWGDWTLSDVRAFLWMLPTGGRTRTERASSFPIQTKKQTKYTQGSRQTVVALHFVCRDVCTHKYWFYYVHVDKRVRRILRRLSSWSSCCDRVCVDWLWISYTNERQDN